MINIYDNGILITQSDDKIYINLDCGYGQPSVTTIYLKKNDVSSVLKTFDNNVINFEIDKVDNLKYNTLEIHTSITDLLDNPVEMTDVSLNIEVYDIKSNSVRTGFTKKTTGKGEIFQSFYTVTIL